jgi:hypothetical protein
MKDLIKKVLKESTDETAEEFITHFEKEKKRVEKLIPKIVNFLKSSLDEYNVYDISIGEIKNAYGSTMTRDENGKYKPFITMVPQIQIRFIELTDQQKRKVGNMIWDQIENIFGIDLTKYGAPIRVKLLNLEGKEF